MVISSTGRGGEKKNYFIQKILSLEGERGGASSGRGKRPEADIIDRTRKEGGKRKGGCTLFI